MSGISCLDADAADEGITFTRHSAGKAAQLEKPCSHWNLGSNIPKGLADLKQPCCESLQTQRNAIPCHASRSMNILWEVWKWLDLALLTSSIRAHRIATSWLSFAGGLYSSALFISSAAHTACDPLVGTADLNTTPVDRILGSWEKQVPWHMNPSYSRPWVELSKWGIGSVMPSRGTLPQVCSSGFASQNSIWIHRFRPHIWTHRPKASLTEHLTCRAAGIAARTVVGGGPVGAGVVVVGGGALNCCICCCCKAINVACNSAICLDLSYNIVLKKMLLALPHGSNQILHKSIEWTNNAENMKNVQIATKYLLLDPFGNIFWIRRLWRLFILIFIFIFQLLPVSLLCLAWLPPSWVPVPVPVWWATIAPTSEASSLLQSLHHRKE